MKKDEEVDVDNLELADTSSRVKAFLIDYFLINVLVTILLWEQLSTTDGSLENLTLVLASAIMQIIFIEIIYETFFLWYYGATIGKILSNIRVIHFDDFSKITFGTAFLRSIFRAIDKHILMFIGFFLYFFTESKQTLHDKIAKTLVVNA
jgi:uncharacterized RDD family membrane protein YckC